MRKQAAFLALSLLATVPLFAQGAPRGEAKAKVAGKAIAVEYGRPSLKGRDMLAQAKVGTPWRMGSDASTTLKTEADLQMGSLAVPKGDYVLSATKVAEDKWEINLTKAGDNAALGSAPLVAEKLGDPVETFTIELSGQGNAGELKLKWGTTALKTGFTAK